MIRQPIRRMARVAGTVAVLAVVVTLMAAGKGILFPDWSGPTKGTYKDPASEVGKKGAPVWSIETMASAVMGKPVEGKTTSLVGEIIDLSCYLQVGKHGDKHRDCGQKCVKNGQPVGLLLEDGTVYMLIDEEHDARRDNKTTFRAQAVEMMAHVVTVHGTLTDVEGMKALYVQGTSTK